MGAKTAYLALYNLACAAGWAALLYKIVSGVLADESYAALYQENEQLLQVVQSVAILEVVHAMVGLVRSPWMTTLMQVSSRLVVVWAFLYVCPSSQGCLGFPLCAVSWGLVEVPRYLFYVVKLFKPSVPGPLFFLRYSLFAVLYPTGITGEVLVMYTSLPCLKERSDLSVGPLSLYLLALVVLAVYVPGAPFMFMNMVSNRKKEYKKRAAEGPRKTD